jgi:2-C-methyl-D-erythritol 2,4-cyclodiphosphate synthase
MPPRIRISEGAPASLRVGFGNDVHRLVSGRRLILGGVRIPFDRGPAAHSDGDALAHAICDALLGAAGLGDIGALFPDTSRRWKNASSLEFLRRARTLLDAGGYAIVNVDSTIDLERPKLSPYRERMRQKLARSLGVRAEQVSVKAKSGEGMGEVGRGEAVRAQATVLLSRR